MSRAPRGAVVQRRFLPDEEAQARALRLLANRSAKPNKAAGTNGGESDGKENRHVPANPSIPDK